MAEPAASPVARAIASPACSVFPRVRVAAPRLPRIAACAGALLAVWGLGTSDSAVAEPAPRAEPGWQFASESGGADARVVLFVESAPVPGRPTFRLETRFPVPPAVVHRLLVEGMLDPKAAPRGQTRKVLARDANGALVHTFIELPLMMADREVALRVRHSHDAATGVHRVEWVEANDVLPPPKGEVVRLAGASGYWEFRPDGQGGTQAIHLTRAEIGGSFPVALGDRLMKGQAVEAVDTLRARVERHTASAGATPSDVAAGPAR